MVSPGVMNYICNGTNFQCSDYNYQRHADGSCVLVPGLDPLNHEEFCRDNPDWIEFFLPTGYRKIPISTCQGGKELDKIEPLPCPGHEDDFGKKHGISGIGLFFAIVIPILAAGGIGWWLYGKWQRGGFGLGQIQLGDGAASTAAVGGGNSIAQALVSIPVALVAGVVAVAKALPLLGMSLFRSARGYVPVGSGARGDLASRGPYRSRDAFATRRQDYSNVVQDEDELLGEDDDGEDV